MNNHSDRPAYTAETIKNAVQAEAIRLFASYSANRPENWACDQRTRDLVMLGNWMDEEHRKHDLDDLGRITQNGRFNREARSTDDLWTLAATIMNDTIAGKIDRDRKAHRRWG
jgi:hypothetical protein